MTGLDHLSYSSISSYLLCPKSWKYKYLDKLPTRPSSALIFGSAVHDAIETAVRHQTMGDVPDLPTIWRTSWLAKVAAEPDFTPDTGDTLDSLQSAGHALLSDDRVQGTVLNLRALVDEQGPVIERKVELHVPGVPIPIVGFVDAVLEGGRPVDFKTSARSWDADKARKEVQTLFYLAAFNQMGFHVPDYGFTHIVFLKTKRPGVQVFEHYHRPIELFWLFDMISHVWKGIEAGVWPANPTGWKCSESMCEYWAICRGR